MRSEQWVQRSRSAILAGLTLATVLGAANGALAQSVKDLKTPDTPLVLKAQGSFFIGGEKSDQTRGQSATWDLAGRSPSIRCTCATWCRRVVRATCRW